MNQSRLSFLALHFIPGIGDHLIKQLISYCGSPENVFETSKGRLLKIPGVGEVAAKAILHGHPFETAEKEIREAERQQVDLLFFTDEKYPKRLKAIHDSPTLLYAKGNMNLENTKVIGIVGTRQSTHYGKTCVEELVIHLAKHDVLIVSGLAYGIDILAHKQALKSNLETIGVLGSGIDIIYPALHAEVAKKMQLHGGLLSENPFGTKPDAHLFPARNRIIAGMVDALVVVEAGKSGGALITAEIANSYHKDVFAYPGNIGQSYSVGCNNLIKSNKAHLITGISDLEYIMGWSNPMSDNKPTTLDLDECDENEKTVITVLLAHGGTLVIDELSWKTNLPVSQLAGVLLSLEFKGMVQSLPGKLFRTSNKILA